MKRKSFIAILLVVSMLSTFFVAACGESDATDESTYATTAVPFSNINEDEKSSGAYQICSSKGVMNIAKYPGETFNLMTDIDMEGATWTPVEFTGNIKGNGHKIYNFTIEATGDNVGFFSENKGTVEKLTLAEFGINLDNSSAKYVGGIAGINSGTLKVVSTKKAVIKATGSTSATIGSGVGYMKKGTIEKGRMDTDLLIDAPVVAGGIIGEADGVKLTNTQSAGRIEFKSSAKATVGLLAGKATGCTFTHCIYIGEMNTLDGKWFTEKIGSGDAECTECWLRDNTNSSEFLSEEANAMRDKCIETITEMATVKWVPNKMLMYTCSDGNQYCSQIYQPNFTYYGLPYTHNHGTIERFNYCFNEDGTFKDWLPTTGYDGFDLYMGCDCTGAVAAAWRTCTTTMNATHSISMLPANGLGTVPIGEYPWEVSAEDSLVILKAAESADVLYEAYAKAHKADAMNTYFNDKDNKENPSKNHAHLLVEDPTVVRDDNGKIVPDDSFTITTGQGEDSLNMGKGVYTTWKVETEETFTFAYATRHYVPISCQELVDGHAPKVDISFEDYGVANNRTALYTGHVKCNYHIQSINYKITTKSGNEVYSDKMFTAISKFDFTGQNMVARWLVKEVDLSDFADKFINEASIKNGKTYHCTISAYIGTREEIELKSFDFEG